METQKRRGISVTWIRPHLTDLTVATCLAYLLHVQAEAPAALIAVVVLIALRCIGVRRAV